MKRIIVLAVLVSLTACSQEQTNEAESPTTAPQVAEKDMAGETKEKVNKPQDPETQIEVLVDKDTKVTKAEQPKVTVMPKTVSPKEEVQTKEVTPVIKAEPTVITEKVEPVAVTPKVVAPLTQGKGDIRSEPKNPPKQGIMLKASLGDAVAGKKVAKKCMSCHTFNQDGKKKTGPNLFGIIGKAKGADTKFKYGTYLKGIGGIWDEESLRAWLKDSKGVAKAAGKKSKMPSQKIKGKKADDLIAYLKTLK